MPASTRNTARSYSYFDTIMLSGHKYDMIPRCDSYIRLSLLQILVGGRQLLEISSLNHSAANSKFLLPNLCCSQMLT
jgi:hypothetical protein